MKNKLRRIFIGQIIPTVAAILICGIFYYINVHEDFMKEVTAYEDDTSEQTKVVKLRIDNWQDYFTLETRLELFENTERELEKVQYVNCLSLKEEYRDKLSTERASFLNVTMKQNSELMKYEITDAETGEWEITGKLKAAEQKGKTNNKHIAWTSSYGIDFEAVQELDSGEYLGQMFLELLEDFSVEAVSGELVFMK